MRLDRQIFWKLSVGIAVTVLAAYVAYRLFDKGVFFASILKSSGPLGGILAVITLCFSLLGLAAWLMIGSLRKRQAWLINAVNWNIRKLREHELHLPPGTLQPPLKADANEVQMRWPWGSHHTKLLGDLEAAARTLWTLYDPDDSSTAPTNDMVADWLVTERGVSKDKARAMASILRADGLPTGPRR